MADFEASEMIHSSAFQEDPDQATLKFLRGDYWRLIHTTEEQSVQLDSVEEASSETVTESLEARASYQVPVSSLEPGLSFSSESLVVSEAWQSEMVSNNRVQSQFGLACVKNMNNAHHVFDELSRRRHKCQQRKKLSLSPKSWMFKFKHKILQWSRSQTDPHQAMDSNNIKYISSSYRAKFGYKWKEYNSRYWRRRRQTYMSRLLCIYQTDADKTLEALKEIQSRQATVMSDGTKVSSLPAKELVPSVIVELRVGDKVPAVMRVLALISSTLRVEQESLTGEIEAVSKTTNVIGLICALIWLINVKYFLSWEFVDGWPINFKFSFEKCTYYFEIDVALAVAAIPEGLTAVITTCSVSKLVTAICNDASVEQSDQQFVSRGMTTEATLKVLVGKIGFSEGLTNASSNCCRLGSELELRIATLAFDRDRKSMGVMVDSSSGNKLLLVKGAVENVLDRSTRIKLLAGSVQELDQYSRDLSLQSLHDMSMGALRCLRFQQNSSSIWHRWRRKPLFLLHLWKRNCWYQRRFLLSGLC